jgi:hypothetical protein
LHTNFLEKGDGYVRRVAVLQRLLPMACLRVSY